MARYTGPKARISRRFKEPIFGKSKAFQKKAYPPGQHGRGRKRVSEYAVQLNEKQKVKYTYGVLERQFANLFRKALREQGITGENMLQLLERRLDNTVYRLGIAPSRRSARQLVRHKHIRVNGDVVSIPSYTLRAGDQVAVRQKSYSLLLIQESLASSSVKKYPWLQWDTSQMSGRLVQIPERDQIPENIKEKLIVELYSK